MSAQPSMRQMATDVATLGTALEAINAQLADIVERLEKIKKAAIQAANNGWTPDGSTLSGNIGVMRHILEREFGRP